MRATYALATPNPQTIALLTSAGYDPLVAQLLAVREIHTVAAARAFVTPQLRDLPDPHLLLDCEKAAKLLVDAVQSGNSICIYGDYDVDGISAAALLSDVLTMAGAAPMVFLPDRMRDGYGLRLERLHELADAGAKVFVSADCGSTAVTEVAAMRARGCEFVICDHHALGPQLPPASAHLNPKQPLCRYPDKNLAAVGVAMVLAQALRRELVRRDVCPVEAIDLRSVMELAALGTIADLVELRDVNRLLAWHGLRALGQSARPGLRALIEHLPNDGVEASRVGFVVGPKINAAGRIAEPRTAFEVLTERNKERAGLLAMQLDIDNNRRKELTLQMTAQAIALAKQTSICGAVVVAHRDWHPGVVGIVAARLVEQFGVPAFAIAIDEAGTARGSGRSVPGYDLVAALRQAALDVLTRCGGHAYAAGITLQQDAIAVFAERMSQHATQAIGATPVPRSFSVDAQLAPQDCTLQLLETIGQLEPFGRGNEAPRFVLRGVQINDMRVVGKTGEWVQAKLHEVGSQRSYGRAYVAAFGALRLWSDRTNGELVDVVCKLDRNFYKGKATVQAMVDLVLATAA